MTTYLRHWSEQGEAIILDAQPLAAGGEARIHRVESFGGQPTPLVAKLYHTMPTGQPDKLRAMLANPPLDPLRDQGRRAIAWPTALVMDDEQGGACLGYLMPHIQGVIPSSELYHPATRKRVCPGFTWRYLLFAARNLAGAMRSLHEAGYVIGDVNESNILIANDAIITWVDTDSFQVPARGGAADRFRCRVGKPEYAAPEILASLAAGRHYHEFDRERSSDYFGLAVMIHQLLLEGTHPCDGLFAKEGDPPPRDERIAQGWYPSLPKRGGPFKPHPRVPPIDLVGKDLHDLFLRCLVAGHREPASRPSAEEWLHALDDLGNRLRECQVNRFHVYGDHLKACPWCRRAEQFGGVDPFPDPAAPPQPLPAKAARQRRNAPTAPPVAAAPALRRVGGGGALPRAIPYRVGVAASQVQSGAPPVRIHRRRRRDPRRWLPWLIVPLGLAVWLGIMLPLLHQPAPDEPVEPVTAAATEPPVVPLVALPDEPPTPRSAVVEPALPAPPSANPPAFGQPFTVDRYGIDFVPLAPGTFRLGSPADEAGRGYDERLVEVTLTAPFWMGKTEVTRAQYHAIMGGDAPDNPLRPVDRVGWHDAAAFCRELSREEYAAGRLPDGYHYRLPTEAEWEYACRAGSPASFCFGDDAGRLGDYAWYTANSSGSLRDVATRLPNAWGLHDLHGNVSEWCLDWYGDYPAEATADPLGPPTGSRRVIRGGSWSTGATDCRSAERTGSPPNERLSNQGFRVVLAPARRR